MPVRVRAKVDTAISSTTAEEKDLGNKKYEVISDGLGEGGTWKTRINAGTTDLEVTLRDVTTASLLAISTNAVDPNQTPSSIGVKKNSAGGEETLIAPLSGTSQGLFLVTTTGLTALYVSNSGSVDMELIITVAGD